MEIPLLMLSRMKLHSHPPFSILKSALIFPLLLLSCSGDEADGPSDGSQMHTGGSGGDNIAPASGGTDPGLGAVGGDTGSSAGGVASGGAGSGGAPGAGGELAPSAGGVAIGTGGADSPTGGVGGETGGTFSGDAATPVGKHGHLQVVGTQLTDQAGLPVQLKGVSSQWLNWETDGYALNLNALIWMRDNWNLSLIRAAMGAESSAQGSYLDAKDPAAGRTEMLRQVKIIVDNAVAADVYVLIDFHSHTAHLHQAEATDFFKQMVELYGALPNVLFEPFNEPKDASPTDTLEWPEIKPYFESIVSTIRENDPDENENVIILGTPRWSQDVDDAALDPLSGSNLMYTLHFYACSHGEKLRAVGEQALLNGLPLFVTEWGATDADGGVDGTPVCAAEADLWHSWMDDNAISWAAWKLDDCDGMGPADTSCLLARDAPLDGGWTEANLNGHGSYVVSKLKN